MLKVKSMAFDELLVAKRKIETEIELRSARDRSRLIEAVGKLSVAAAKSQRLAILGPMLSKEEIPRAPQSKNRRKPGRTGPRPRAVSALKGGKKLETFAFHNTVMA